MYGCCLSNVGKQFCDLVLAGQYLIRYRVPQFILHKDVVSDLHQIKNSGDLGSYGVLLAFLQQAKQDTEILDHLEDDGYGEDNTTTFSIRKWIEQTNKGRGLWRIKVFTPKGLSVPYRIIYAAFPHKQTYSVIAILSRALNYEESQPRVQQLIATYDRLVATFNGQ
jgi:hypothetical protein